MGIAIGLRGEMVVSVFAGFVGYRGSDGCVGIRKREPVDVELKVGPCKRRTHQFGHCRQQWILELPAHHHRAVHSKSASPKDNFTNTKDDANRHSNSLPDLSIRITSGDDRLEAILLPHCEMLTRPECWIGTDESFT